ncbi:MAG: hypothetical protein ACTJG2_00175 [Candidatus Saccharimonadales bacterium]
MAQVEVAAINHLHHADEYKAYNIGTGKGVSVLELITAFGEAAGEPVPYEIVARRPGDVAACYANPALAERELGWKAELDIRQACEDSWRWQSQNPGGYRL